MESLDGMIESIRAHRVSGHPVFQTWSESRPMLGPMAAVFLQWMYVKAASRDPGRLPSALVDGGWSDAAEAVAEALATERGHDVTYLRMVGQVLGRTPGGEAFEGLTDVAEVRAHLEETSLKYFDAIGARSTRGVLAETQRVLKLLAERSAATADSAPRVLGTFAAVEIVAGPFLLAESQAVLESSHYALAPDDPTMEYFAEHLDQGLEIEHASASVRALRSVWSQGRTDAIRGGATEWCDRFARHLDVMQGVLRRG